MTNEELIKRVEGLQHEVALLQSEYSSGMEKIHGVVKTLLAGEHFHALSPVMDAMPIADFKARLADLYKRVVTTVADARVVEPAKAKPPVVTTKEVEPAPQQG